MTATAQGPLVDPRAMPLVEVLQRLPKAHGFEAYENGHGVLCIQFFYGRTLRELAQFANRLDKDWWWNQSRPNEISIQWADIWQPEKKRHHRGAFVQILLGLGQRDEAIKALECILRYWT